MKATKLLMEMILPLTQPLSSIPLSKTETFTEKISLTK